MNDMKVFSLLRNLCKDMPQFNLRHACATACINYVCGRN